MNSTTVRRNSTAKNVAITTLGNFSGPAVALVTAPILAQSLGVIGRGELAAATAPLLLATTALTLGLPDALTHLTAKGATRARIGLLKVGPISLLVGGLGCLVISLLAPVLGAGSPSVPALIQGASLLLVPALLAGLLRGVARGKRFWHLVALDQAVGALLRLIAILALRATGTLDLHSAVWVTAIGLIAGCPVYLAMLHPKSQKTTVHADPVTLSTFLGYGMGVWLGSVSGVLLARLDQAIFLPLSTAAQLGVYAVAVSISEVVRAFNTAVRDVTFTNQSEKADPIKLGQAARVSTLVTLVAATLVFTASVPLVPKLFGDEFRPAVLVIAVLLVGTTVGNPGSVAATGVSARGKPILRSLAILLGLIINVIVLVLLAPKYGALGAAIASSVANAATGFAVMIIARHQFGTPIRSYLGLRRSDLLALGSLTRRTREKRS